MANLPPPSHALLGPLNGTPVYLGRITVAANSKNNATTLVPFGTSGDALEGKVLLLAASAAMDVGPVNSAAGTVDATTGVPIDVAPGDRPIIVMASGYKWLAANGTGDLDVWELK
jgi:hypothetical protein